MSYAPSYPGTTGAVLPEDRTTRYLLYGAAGLVGATLLVSALGYRGAIGYSQGSPRLLLLRRIGFPAHFLVPAAARAFQAMSAAARKDGVTLQVNSAFRSYVEQAALFAKHCAEGLRRGKWIPPQACVPDPPTARPGRSNHQLGLAVDIQTDGGENVAYRWLTENAGKYGFQRTVPAESWHWEYRGGGSALAGVNEPRRLPPCLGCGGC